MLVQNLMLALVGLLAATGDGAPTEVAYGNSAGPHSERAPAVSCGLFQTLEGIGPLPAYANGHYENVDLFEHIAYFDNLSCGICILFQGRDAQGDILWSGGPNQSTQILGAQSYYCIYGPLPPRAISAEAVNKHASRDCEPDEEMNARDGVVPLTTCGHYWDDRHCHPQDVLADGHYENVALNTIINGFTNKDCGICMVFKGRDATGDELWWGGPGNSVSKEVEGAQSYFCIKGPLPPNVIETQDQAEEHTLKELARRKAAEAREAIAAGKALQAVEDTKCSRIRDLIKAISDKSHTTPTNTPAQSCGNYTAVVPGVAEQVFSIAADGHYQSTIDRGTMTSFSNQNCGFCIVFKGPDCSGDVMYSGGPGDYTDNIKGARSYFCY